MFIPLTSIDVGSAAHQANSTHDAQNECNRWGIFADFKVGVKTDGFNPEMVDQPAENEQCGARYGADAEYYEGGVMSCSSTDPAMRKGRFLSQMHRYYIAEDDGAERDPEGTFRNQ